MASCGTPQIGRKQMGRGFWPCWASWVLFPSWIIWSGIWSSNGSACSDKPGYPYFNFQKGPWLTTAWPCTPLLDHILPHIFPPPPGWWGFWLDSRSELGGLLLPPGSRLGSESGFSMCLRRRPPWYAPLRWKIWVDLTLSGTSQCLLGVSSPCNSPSWVRKVLIGHHNLVPRSVPC